MSFQHVVVFLFAGFATVALADPFTFTPVDVPGAAFTAAYGINNDGQVVGGSSLYPFLDTDGSFTQIIPPGGGDPYGINDAGQIVGTNFSAAGFLDTNGIFTPIAYPNSLQTAPFGINNNGDVVGLYEAPFSGTVTGFVYAHGKFEPVYPNYFPGVFPLSVTVWGINNGGFIAGYYLDSDSKYHGFFGYGPTGSFTTIDYPGATEGTYLTGINDRGEVVGFYGDSAGDVHSFVYCIDSSCGGFGYAPGTFTPLDVPGATSTNATGINDAGQVVGSYWNGPVLPGPVLVHGYVATPVPESSSLLLLAIIVLLIHASARRTYRKRAV